MSNKLYRLGIWAFRHRWWVVVFWIIAVITAVSLMVRFQEPVSDSFSIPNTESQEAFDKLEAAMPASAGSSGRIVFAAPEGEQLSNYKGVIDQTVTSLSEIDDVAGAVSPFQAQAISSDGRIGLAQVNLDGSPMEVREELAKDITQALEPAREAGLQAETSSALAEFGAPSIMGPGEIIGVVVAGITLAITFGALVAASMPLVTAFIGVGIGVSAVYALSGVVDVNTVTPTLAIMLGLAVGMDYSLFIVTRYRKFRMDGLSPIDATARAIATAGNAVVFAALTVVIALSGLAVVGIPFMTVMGLAAAGTVAIAASVAITLIPALLGFGGNKVLSKKQRKSLANNHNHAVKELATWARKYIIAVTKHPILIAGIIVVMLAAVAAPTSKLHLGFPTDASAPAESSERKAYDLVTKGFGPGFNGPLLVMAEFNEAKSPEQIQQQMGQIMDKLSQQDSVSVVQPAGTSPNGDLAVFQVIPTTGPSDTKTTDLVERLRDQKSVIAGEGTSLYVTGQTAITLDMDNLLADALPKYILLVVGLSLALLIIVFRSIIVPLKATLGFLLTIMAVFGALVMLFQWGWFGIFDPSPIVSFLPIILVGILFGLAMDYEFFLVSGMHESYVHEDKGNPKAAVIDGFAHNASVVTAAAIIMISVFSGFIITDMQMVQMIGFALAFGILVDAFLIRMTFVPAVMTIFGKAAWWLPKWLDKLLPDVSIEGDSTTVEKYLKKPKK